MLNLRTILATTAIAALAAFPVAALTVDTSADVQLTPLTEAEATAAANAMTSADAAATPVAPDAAAFAANAVVSADDEVIGTVSGVEQGDGGNIKLIIALDASIGSQVKAFSVQLAPDAKADGTVKLGWNKADLLSTLESQVAG